MQLQHLQISEMNCRLCSIQGPTFDQTSLKREVIRESNETAL